MTTISNCFCFLFKNIHCHIEVFMIFLSQFNQWNVHGNNWNLTFYFNGKLLFRKIQSITSIHTYTVTNVQCEKCTTVILLILNLDFIEPIMQTNFLFSIGTMALSICFYSICFEIFNLSYCEVWTKSRANRSTLIFLLFFISFNIQMSPS